MKLSELALPKIDITSDAFAADPFTPYREAYKRQLARRKHPPAICCSASMTSVTC